MLKWTALAVLALAAGILLVRTWRFEHSEMRVQDLGQYLHDKIETDESFLSRAPKIPLFETRGESVERVLQRFTDATNIPLDVRWDALARSGVKRDFRFAQSSIADIGPGTLLWLLLHDAGMATQEAAPPFPRYDLSIRVRHGTVIISTTTDMDPYLVWRSYPVGDLVDWYQHSTIDRSRIAGFTYLHPHDDDERLIALIECTSFARPQAPFYAPHIARLRGGTLELRTSLEDHVKYYELIQYVREQWKSGGALGGRIGPHPVGAGLP